MVTREHYRAKAAEYGELAKTANGPDQAREYQQRECSLTMLADNAQWLADHHDQTVHAVDAGAAEEGAPASPGDATAAVQP